MTFVQAVNICSSKQQQFSVVLPFFLLQFIATIYGCVQTDKSRQNYKDFRLLHTQIHALQMYF